MRKLLLTSIVASVGFLWSPGAFAGDTDGTQTDNLWHQADKYYGKAAMDAARKHEIETMGGLNTSLVIADRLETQIDNGDDVFLWDAQAWYGNDDNKLWIKTEGEYNFATNKIEDAELQALWSKPIAAFWDLQTGIRYDFDPKGRTYLVGGVQGLAPYWFEIDAAGFLSNKGDVTARVEAEYDMLWTQRLILQPRVELNLAAQDVPELSIGTGLSSIDAGLRLRYEITREFAPYIGVEWQKKTGRTADFTRTAGEDPNAFKFLIGVRTWY